MDSLLEPYIKDIVEHLQTEAASYGGKLPDLKRIGWHAYLNSGVIDHVDYELVKDHFPNFSTDPDGNDPVLAIAIGKHYFDPDPTISPGTFIDETEFEGLRRKISEDKNHLGGELSPGFAVAWYGKLLGLHDRKEISDSEYKQLVAMLPVLENNPVAEVQSFTRRFITPDPAKK